MTEFGVSEKELKLIKEQAARRAQLRNEFLKQKTNPWKHANQAYYVFDPNLQKFMSMKVRQLDQFQANTRTGIFGFCTIVIPMLAYGCLIWNHRNERERQIRCGELLYKDRLFKFQ